MLKNSTFFLFALAFFLGSGLHAQDLQRLALENLQTEYAELGLDAADVSELRLVHQYASKNGVEHLTIQQFYNNVPIYNGQAGLHYKNGRLVFRTSNLYHGLAAMPTSVPTVSMLEALYAAARPMDITTTTRPAAAGQENGKYIFNWPEVAAAPITAELKMVPHGEELLVSWQFFIDQVNTPDMWVAQVDAVAGTLIARHNQTVYCSFDAKAHRDHKLHANHACTDNVKPTLNPNLPLHEAMVEAVLTDGASYNVYPFGIEAPIYGEREVIVNPAHPVASPHGWHDTNNQPGPEYTYTRGNNTNTYLDRDDSNSPDPDRAEGGDSLVFDFFYEQGASPDIIGEAAMTQLFYMTNMVHDFTYTHGFDEAAGNFQQNNYGNGGASGDPIQAEAQDGGGTNNANFGTPPDGGSGRMQMYIWNNAPTAPLSVDSPESIAGEYVTGNANFGPEFLAEPVTAEVVVAVDNTSAPELLCGAVANASAVAGKIAMVTRGECFFEEKTFNAQDAGAVGIIICNVTNEVITMGGGVDDANPDIPAAMLSSNDCARLLQQMNNDIPVIVTFPAIVDNPPVDGDFDNGIVAHEIGHGISNRLVGSPVNTGCLGNGEQMGEGWSDFFSLVTSPINGSATMPDGTEPRGIGNFATDRGVNGGGIRTRPYSTDMSVNAYTYDRSVLTNGVHSLGEVWATTLWDLYWAMVEDHGFDEDLIDGDGGNNIAVQLVIEGMKFTSCSPGMIDGRDGILAADEVLFDGANTCRIWDVFARRGMGFSAIQGSSNAPNDGREAFDVNPACIPTVKVSKRSNLRTIDSGQEVTFTVIVRNDKATTANEIVVTEEIPAGMTFIPSSVNGVESFLAGDGQVIFNVGDLDPEDQETFTYRVSTSPDIFSTGSFFDGAEGDDENWIIEPLNGEGSFIWEQAESNTYEGDFVWYAANAPEDNDQVLQSVEPFQLIGSSPAVRFFTNYQTEPGWDAGMVEMSLDGSNWTNVGNDRIIRGKYRGNVQPSAFDATVEDLSSYWGDSEGYFDVYIDFADMVGEEVYLRWRFGSDSNNPVEYDGWYVDNIQVIDLRAYNMTTTLTSATDDNATITLDEGGVIIEVKGETVDVVDPNLGLTSVKVFPNPANEFLKVYVRNELGGEATVQLIGVDGRLVAQQSLQLLSGGQTVQFNTAALPAGIYLVQVLGADRVHTEKVTIQ